MKFTYILVNLFTVLIPFIFSFHPKLKFHKYFNAYFSANVISASVFILWDAVFTAKGIWGFNEKYITGIKIFYLPLEEILFFFCIPFACIFTYHCLTKYFRLEWNKKTETLTVAVVSAILIVTGLINLEKSYTSVTFISTGILMIIFRFILNVTWFDKLITVYSILLIPFFIVNGILTGTGLEEPVVWYDNSQNLGLRIFTIPIEDSVYGFELIMLTLFLFEKIKQIQTDSN